MRFIEEKTAKLCSRLRQLANKAVGMNLEITYVKSGYKQGNTPPVDGWQPFNTDTRIGGFDQHFWFHIPFHSPKVEPQQEVVFQLITGEEGKWDAINPQAMFYLNGEMLQGLDINHTQVVIPADTDCDVYIYFYIGTHENEVRFIPSVLCLDKRIEKLFFDLKVPFDACRGLDKIHEDHSQISKLIEIATNMVDMRVPYSDEFYASVEAACEFLDKELYNGICADSLYTVNCTGHTHIDIAWLWTVAQTREKAQRSFATVINLMKQYPEYKFMSSQPILYQMVKEENPELYAQIKEMVRQGRWDVEGAMWLECDCNLTSGESLIRQILFGKRFMKQEFGVDSKTLWLPDVFGYSAAMPQILNKCGVDTFVTSKISWNEYNKMPYDTFIWEGIDGSQIFTDFIVARGIVGHDGCDTMTLYVGDITPDFVRGTVNRYQQKKFNTEVFIPFGHGDGGGGPTKEMLENQRRLKYGLPGFPKTVISTTGEYISKSKKNFFKNCEQLKRCPKWVGELYLELHRGTYTSIAKNKKNNRKSELSYQMAEALCAINTQLLGSEYPQQKINDSWKTILLNQFHDILPGSSIRQVYEDCDRDYAEILETSREIIDEKFSAVVNNIQTDGGLVVYNALPFERSGCVEVDGKTVYVENIPSLGWRVVDQIYDVNTIKVSDRSIENSYYSLRFDDSGALISIFDKCCNREIVKTGQRANEIRIFEDDPRCYDAWEITDWYKQKMWTIDDAEFEPVVDGVRAGIKITKKYLNSVIQQTVYLYENLKRIDFVTAIDWYEEHHLVKAFFPLDINASKATYDIQFGNIERNTHENTTWDYAKFEVCAHKWADVSDGGFGVSILNDCKYGYSTLGSDMSLTLLKCATYPNEVADKGHHEFTYSLFSHEGDFRRGGTVQQAYGLNQPLICKQVNRQSGKLDDNYSFISCDRKNIIVETVKKAEDSDDIIVRLYETDNCRCETTLTFGFDFKKAVICDMLENEQTEVAGCGNQIRLDIKSFEIVTLKIVR